MAAEHRQMNGQGRQGSGPSKAELIERRLRVWELALMGKSFRAIAQELGVSTGTAFNDFQAHAKEIKAPVAEEVRKQELHRLDMLLDKLTPRVEQGDPQAVAAYLRVMERRSKYLGLDAPAKQDVTVHQADPMDTALGELIREQQLKQALEEQALREGEE